MPRFSASFIAAGRVYQAFVDDIPEELIPKDSVLWQYHTEESEPRKPEYFQTTHSAFEPKTTRRRSGGVERQMAEMDAAAREEDEREDEPLSQPVKDAIAPAQENHAAHVSMQKAQMEIDVKHSDMLTEDLIREQDEKLASGEFDSFEAVKAKSQTPPLSESLPSDNGKAKPKSRSKLFVTRDGTYLPASTVTLVKGEDLWRHRPRSFGVSAR